MRMFLAAVAVLASCTGAFAEPKVTEYDDKVVVEYSGKPPAEKELSKQKDDAKTAELLDKIQARKDEYYRIEKENEDLLRAARARAQVRPEDEIKVSGISVMEMSRSYNYVTLSIKADLDNSGERGDVSVKLVGKNREGHQVDFVLLDALLGRKESRTVTTTTMLTLQQAMDVREWEVERVYKFRR